MALGHNDRQVRFFLSFLQRFLLRINRNYSLNAEKKIILITKYQLFISTLQNLTLNYSDRKDPLSFLRHFPHH